MTDDGAGPSAFLADRYSSDAETYDALWSPVIRPVGDALIEAMNLQDATRVLDAGVGAGALVPAIRQAAPDAAVVGLDVSPGMVEIAAGRHGLPCVVGDAMALPVAGGSVDAVVLAYVLFHLRRPAAALAEAVRALRADGTVGTVTWATEGTIAAGSLLDSALDEIGAPAAPWSGNHEGLNSTDRIVGLLRRVGLTATDAWTEVLEHQFTLETYWRLRVTGGNSGWRLRQLDAHERSNVLERVRRQFEAVTPGGLLYRGQVIAAVGELA